jgi:hypothetical protein
MAELRRQQLLAQLFGDGNTALETKRLCQLCADVTGVSGAGIMLMSGDVPRGSLCTTNDVSALIERLQFDLGEGPCVDAYNHDRPVLEPDLAHPAAQRWVAFTEPAVEAGVRAIFGFPLQIGAVRLGALNLYCNHVGALSAAQYSDALVMADISAQAVLLMQASAPPGAVAAELEAGADFRIVVHHATGMVAAQLDTTVGQAVMRLRAYAFGNERSLTEVAEQVVARNLRFDADIGENDSAA